MNNSLIAQTDSFIDYVEMRIRQRSDINDVTRKNHRKILSCLRGYGKIQTFADLTKRGIVAFDNYLHSRRLSQVSICDYHKIMKVYVNDAIRAEIIDLNPYKGIKIARGTSNVRRYLSQEELAAVETVQLSRAKYERVRDMFVFQCYTGFAYVELREFQYCDIQEHDGKLVVSSLRHKTHQDFYVVLLAPARKILEKYHNHLPLVSLTQYNKHLKAVAREAGLRRNLTSHMARHTFAVWCLNSGCRIENLSKMMGHSDIRTTQLYAKVLNREVEAEFDRLEQRIADRNS
jgi:site-specific recombinase XerD